MKKLKILFLLSTSLIFSGCSQSQTPESNSSNWPIEDIENSLNLISPNTKTVIPSFEAESITANYYQDYNALAINAQGYADNIIETYKDTLTSKDWNVFFNDESDEYNAISSAKDIEIHFYIEEEKSIFNVDVFSYKEPIAGWPYEEIARVVKEMGASGEVLPFLGKNDGFEVNTDYFPPAIYIFVEKSKQESFAEEYNQSLIDAGYLYAGDQFGDPTYAYPGTTLAYRAIVIVGVLEIELFKLDSPAK